MKWRLPAICTATVVGAIIAPAAVQAAPQRAASAQLPSVRVPPGYDLRRVATDLDFPTGITFGEGKTWVSEAGIPPGRFGPRVVRLLPARQRVRKVLAASDLPQGTILPPLIDATYNRGRLWITHRQRGVNGWAVGAISSFNPDDPVGTFKTAVTNLPSSGDHFTEELVFDRAGRGYFGQGTATNTSVVGPDNELVTRWLESFPQFHDFPAKDVVLSGEEYETPNVLTDDVPDDTAVTAPFMPFNSGPVDEGTVVPAASVQNPQQGIVAGVGTVYSFDSLDENPATTLRLEAWGLRNPFGVGLDPLEPGRLFVTNNGADIRSIKTPGTGPIDALPETELGDLEPVGARPLANDYDDMGIVEIGGEEEFFGWPDYAHDPDTGEVLPVTDPLFCQSPLLQPECSNDFALSEDFRETLEVQPAFAQFEVHSSANKFDFSTQSRFGFRGDIFVAETGGFIPQTGALQFAGYKVVRVDRDTGRVRDFIVNTGNTVDEVFNRRSFNKPIDIKFRGRRMLILDFGIFEPGIGLARPRTGKVWAVTAGCPTLSVAPRSIAAGRRSTVRIIARRAGQRTSGVRLRVRGSGVNRRAVTKSRGIARLTVRPRAAGVLRVTVRGKQCAAQRIGVSAGQPSLTG